MPSNRRERVVGTGLLGGSGMLPGTEQGVAAQPLTRWGVEKRALARAAAVTPAAVASLLGSLPASA